MFRTFYQKMRKRVLQFINAVVLVLALFSELVQGSTNTDNSVDWWESAALYQIYPRSFQDSNGDGVGDLNGITSRLEYLKEIGITAAWLSPIFESPMADFGYDISNFTRIDPIFGTIEDFDAMIAKAKRVGVKIILDFVPNHSSDECVWFEKSVLREPGYEEYYVWDDGRVDPNNASARLPPCNWISVFRGPQWTWHPVRKQFFQHQFLVKQPDLNFNSQLVHQEMISVLKYWLDRGVDGFRIDAVPHIYEKRNDDGTYPDEPLSGVSDDPNSWEYHDHIYTKDQYPTVELMYEWRAFLDDYQKQNGGDSRVLLAEAYSPIEMLSKYFGNATHSGTQIPMNFNLMNVDVNSEARDVVRLINDWMSVMWSRHQVANWVVGNHDGPRVATRLGRQRVDLLNIIVNSLPGASVTYYGEEIGMINVPTECTPISCDDRDPGRSPMQWSKGKMAGFTNGSTTWLPIANDSDRYNVEVERGMARSTLQIFKGLQKLKTTSAFKAFKEPGGFSYEAISDKVLQIVRTATNSEEYRILVNMGNQLEVVENLVNKTMEFVLLSPNSPRNKGDKIDLSGRLYLMPYEAVILRWFAK